MPNFSPASGLETNRSDYVAGLYLAPFTGLSLVAQSRFDENDWSLRRQDTAAGQLRAAYGTLGYTFTHFDPVGGVFDNQQELLTALGLRLTNHWSILGQLALRPRCQHAHPGLIQLKYQDECFVLTASYIETFVENPLLESGPTAP